MIRRMQIWKSLVLLMALQLAMTASHADSLLEYSRLSGNGQKSQMKAYVRGSIVYLPAINPSPRVDLIFEQASQRFTVIDHANKRYSQFTESEITSMIKQGQDAISAMQGLSESLGQLSPGLQKSLGSMLPESDTSPRQMSYQQLPKQRSIGGMSCQSYVVLENQQPTASLCLAVNSVQNRLGADYQPLASMLAISRRLANQSRSLASIFKISLPQLGSELEGLPLEIVDAPTSSRIQLSTLSSGLDLADLPLNIPEGYRKVALMMMAASS